MESKPLDVDTKYQKLATEYSKLRSQVSVLRKALLDEQSKSGELNEVIKMQEQTIRKQDQEMESLTFRNQQLYKRTFALQQDLQDNLNSRKSKSKPSQSNSNHHTDGSSLIANTTNILDEELQKKILENAKLITGIADREDEISIYKDKNQTLERRLLQLEEELVLKTGIISEQNTCLIQQKEFKETNCVRCKEKIKDDEFKCNFTEESQQINEANDDLNEWKEAAEHWKYEYNLLRSRPSAFSELDKYYEIKFDEILTDNTLSKSEAKSLWAENCALNSRLESLVLENDKLQVFLETGSEELRTTVENYKSQLDALTEHLAAQNDKITKQCDEILDLKIKALGQVHI